MPDEYQVRSDQQRRLSFLNSLYDLERGGVHFPTPNRVANAMGIDGSDNNSVDAITGPLWDDGYIAGPGGAGSAGPLRVRLTDKGRQLVESKAIGEEPPGGASSSIGDVHISGSNGVNINIQQQSPGASSSQAVNIDSHERREIAKWMDEIEQHAPNHGLNNNDMTELMETVQEVRAALTQEKPDRARLRTFARHILRIIRPGAKLATAMLVTHGDSILKMLTS